MYIIAINHKYYKYTSTKIFKTKKIHFSGNKNLIFIVFSEGAMSV